MTLAKVGGGVGLGWALTVASAIRVAKMAVAVALAPELSGVAVGGLGVGAGGVRVGVLSAGMGVLGFWAPGVLLASSVLWVMTVGVVLLSPKGLSSGATNGTIIKEATQHKNKTTTTPMVGRR